MRRQLSLALACACALGACRSDPPLAVPPGKEAQRPGGRSGDAHEEPPAPSAHARWVAPRPADEAAFLALPARALAPPGSAAAVAPPFAGRVVRSHVQAGAPVRKGAPLVDFLMPDVATAAATYASAGARLDAYLARRKQLEALKSEGLARFDEMSENDVRLAEARAERLRALALLRSAGVGPAEATRVAGGGGLVTLRSPIEGVVVAFDAPIGQAREAGGAPLVQIAGDGPLRVEARLSHALPDGARFELVAAGRAPIPVALASRAPAADGRDGQTLAWFDPLAPVTPPLPPGTPGTLRVRLPASAGVVLVPTRALFRREGKTYVLARTPNGASPVAVEPLTISGSEALVRGALSVDGAIAAEAPAAPPAGDGDDH